MESDSDDELMSALTNHNPIEISMECSYCQIQGATFNCPMCNTAIYCDETCQRRHFQAHRQACINARTAAEKSEEEDVEEEYTDESDTDEEENDKNNIGPNGVILPRTNRRNSRHDSLVHSITNLNNNGITIPGLSEKQLKKLLHLSSQTTNVEKQAKAIAELESKIKDILLATNNNTNLYSPSKLSYQDHNDNGSSSINKKDFQMLQQQLQALEKKAAVVALAAEKNNNYYIQSSNVPLPLIYKPLLVKDDEMFKKFFKLKDMDMPTDQIKLKMQEAGYDPSLIDRPNAISPNDPGPAKGAYVPLTVGEDPQFNKYFKLKNMNMPIEQIKMKMEVDGVDPNLLDEPNQVSPNDPGPIVTAPVSKSLPLLPFPGTNSISSVVPYIPLYIKNDSAYQKYFKLLKMGMPVEQVQTRMKIDGIDPEIIHKGDEVSPNDPGPPVNGTNMDSIGSMNSPIPGGMSLEALFTMVMQHQQMIEQGGRLSDGNVNNNHTNGEIRPAKSVKDQMALELAAAENAVDDIFGEDDGNQTGGMGGGMTMVQQLEKKARKDSNKIIVENRKEIVILITSLIDTKFNDVEHAILFYKETSEKLEKFNLCLGSDSNQIWSARLLIKNKDTKDWYFSEKERLDAGNAYIRLWYLSVLTTNIEQIDDKIKQIKNASIIFNNSVKNKIELIDKYINLLKDAVKLKHKIFKNNQYMADVSKMKELCIPQDLEKRCDHMMNSSVILAISSLDLAIEEYNLLEKTNRSTKKIKAFTIINISEKSIQLVNIVNKISDNAFDKDENNRNKFKYVEEYIKKIKDEYITGKEEEEEEDVI